MRVTVPMFVVALLLFGLQVASAAQIVIDFESSPGPDGLLGTADDIPTPVPCIACLPLGALGYGALGINFTSGSLSVDEGFFKFPGHGPNNHISSSSVPDATLSIPVYKISLSSYSIWTLTMYAFDASGAILDTDTFANPPQDEFALSRLEVISATPIARFTVRPEGCLPSEERCDRILNIDDMVFDTQPQPASLNPTVNVPTLNSWLLVVLVALISWIGWRQAANYWTSKRRR